MHEDAELLRAYADEGSNDAFAEVVRRHVDLVYSAALRRLGGDAHRASDVTQQVFTLLARDARRLCHHPALTGWLYTATRNAAVDVIRSEMRRIAREKEAAEMSSLDSEPNAEWARLRPVLDGVMDRLSARDREVILLRFFAGRPFRDIGSTLRVSEDAARMRVDRALERLRALLERRGIRSTASALGLLLAHQAIAAAPAGLAPAVATTAAAVGAAPLGAVNTFVLMITPYKAVGLVGAIALLSIGLGVRESQLARAATLETAARRQEMSELTPQFETARQRTAALEAQLPRAGVAAAAGARAGTASAGTPAAGPSVRDRKPVGGGAVAPEQRIMDLNLQLEREKARLLFSSEWRNLGIGALPFVNRIGATAEQVAAFTALADRDLDAERFADWPNRWNVETYPAEMRREWDDEARGILGNELYGKLARLLRARDSVTALTDYVSRFDLPVSSAQANQLVTLIAESPGVLSDTGGIEWGTLYPLCGGILTPAQIDRWKYLNDLRQRQRVLMNEVRRTAPPSPA